MPFYHTEKVPSIISLLFLLKGVWDYVKFILYIYEAVICFSPFIFLTWHISLIDFSNAKPTLHSWIKHHLVVMYYPLYSARFDWYFVKEFCICVHDGYCSINFFSYDIFVRIKYWGYACHIKWVGKCSICLYRLKELMKDWY